MRGSVWILIEAYLTNRRNNVFGRERVYGYAEVREVNTIGQQKLQYYKALNKALATYRSRHNLDSDTEVQYRHINDGITYEGSKNGIRQIKRKKTLLSGGDKRSVRVDVLKNHKQKYNKEMTQKQLDNMYYNKKVTQKEFNTKSKPRNIKKTPKKWKNQN
jgi:hypothetical protein